MFRRAICVLAIAASLSVSAPAAADEPLKPVANWVVHYDTTECRAQRSYGDPANPILLAMGPSVWGDTYQLMVATKGQRPQFAEELEGSVDFGSGPIKAWVLHYSLKNAAPYSFIRMRLSGQDIAKARSASMATFRVRAGPDVSFTLASIPALMDKLQDCMFDLQHYWNMVDPEQKSIASPAEGELRSLFSSGDYPAEAMQRGQQGIVQFLLFVDEQGKIAGCDVVKASGIPVLDVMGCQVIQQRAKFKPAIDSQGKPIRSVLTTPPIIWRM